MFKHHIEASLKSGVGLGAIAQLAEAVGKPEQVLSRSTVATLAARLAADPGPLPALIFYGSLAEIGGDGA